MANGEEYATSVKLPIDLRKRLKLAAIVTEKTLNEIITTAISRYLKKLEEKYPPHMKDYALKHGIRDVEE